MKTYRFLLFDADKTLLDFDADMLHAFQATYQACFGSQKPYSTAMLDCYETCNNRWWDKFERQECTKPQLFEGRFRDFMGKAGLTGNPEEINRVYFENLGQGGALLPGALELVRDLAPRYQQYIVTNGNAASQKTRLERSGLLRYVKAFFVSEAAGAAKPDKAYFDYVFARIPEFRREEALLIGDSLTSDMQGAQNAGVDSLWFAPLTQPVPEGLTVTYRAQDFDSIRKLLL
ncbi:MAG: YjjG family noncanonical pyrimidine nucleotidase [Acutalibacter sp.]